MEVSRRHGETGRGRRTSSPPQFGQTCVRAAAQSAQNVHSKTQMYASSVGASVAAQRSHDVRSSSAIAPLAAAA